MSEYFHLSPQAAHIGLITFSETAHLHIPFNKHQNHEDFFQDIDNTPFQGHRTRIDLAFSLANRRLFESRYGAREGVEKLLILLTDGQQDAGDITRETLQKAYNSSLPLLRKNVTITAIGLYGRLKPDKDMLTYLTKNEEHVHIIEDFDDLLSVTFLEALLYKYTNKHCQGTFF